jgi:thiol-disulfide isomerase/thioredoxin
MAYTRKNKKSNNRKTSRRRTSRSAVAGKILPPLDIRSNKQFSEFEKRLKKGPLTIVMVYADWCGHCHTMMPHFDAAAKSPSRSIQAVKLNENVLSDANSYMAKNMGAAAQPISVEGYPSIMLIDNKGKKVTDIETVRDTNTMKEVMSQSGKLAVEAGIANESGMAATIANSGKIASMNIDMNEGAITSLPKVNAPKVSLKRNNQKIEKVDEGEDMGEDKDKDELTTLNSFNAFKEETVKSANRKPYSGAEAMTSLTAPIVPPSISGDIVTYDANSKQRGGSLYGSVAQTAYKLAPTAVLLSIATATMQKRRRVTKKAKRSTKRSKSMKRRA